MGLVLGWVFGMRLVESIFLVALTVLNILRVCKKIQSFKWTFVLTVVTSCISVVASGSEEWLTSPRGVMFGTHDTLAWASIGPQEVCSCRTIADKCGDVQSTFAAVGAFAIIRVILLFTQMAFVSAIPVLLAGRAKARVAVSWLSMIVYVLVWGIALGAFNSCGCGGLLYGQRINWPFVFEIVGFVAQCLYTALETLRRCESSLHEWMEKQPQYKSGSDMAALSMPAGRQTSAIWAPTPGPSPSSSMPSQQAAATYPAAQPSAYSGSPSRSASAAPPIQPLGGPPPQSQPLGAPPPQSQPLGGPSYASSSSYPIAATTYGGAPATGGSMPPPSNSAGPYQMNTAGGPLQWNGGTQRYR